MRCVNDKELFRFQDGPSSRRSMTDCMTYIAHVMSIYATTCDFQQYGILPSVDSDEPVQPHFKLRNSKICSASSFRVMKYSSD